VISTLTARMRQQAEGSRQRERRTSALYEMSRELVSTGDVQTLLRRGLQHVGAVFESEAVLLLPDAFGELQIGAATSAGAPAEFGLEPQERAVARWVFDNGRPAGAGTATLAGASALYLPLPASRGIVGVLGVQAQDRQRFRDPEQLHLLETFANQIALAVERARLAEESRRIRELEEVERLKSEFVALASERLREPITRIEDGLHRLQGSAPAADRDGKSPLPELARELRRLRRLVDHLLDLAGLEAGRLQLRVERIGPRGLVERAVSAHADDARREGVELTAEAPASLPEVRGDPERLADALSKLVSSALHRTGPGGRVLVAAQEVAGAVQFSVADNGPGIPIELQSQIFERFTPVEPSEDGTGLELAIVREVVRAHGGLIWVDSSPFPGTIFSFTLPKAGPEDGPVVVAPEPAA
jgi:two-component system sensor histidine kinase KdpD